MPLTGLTPPSQVLRLQGAFAVYRANQEIDRYFPIALNGWQVGARQRIKSVEITTAINKIHIAKIEFSDPEYSILENILEAWNYQNRENPLAETWTVKIGYFDTPESTWASFSGIPQVADYQFPRRGNPSITIVLFSAIIALKKNRTPTGHHIASNPAYPSVRRALQNIAQHYGLGLNLGSLDEIVTKVDNAFKAQIENPSAEINQYFDGNRAAIKAYKNLSDFEKTFPDDYAYLEAVGNELVNIYREIASDHITQTELGTVQDDLWTAVAHADDTLVIDVRGGTLYVCLMKDLIKDLGRVTLYSYREGERTLLEFRPLISQSETQTSGFGENWLEDEDIFARNYSVVAKHLEADSLAPPEHMPRIPAIQADSMDYATPSDPKASDISDLQAPKGLYLTSSLTGQPPHKQVTLNWLVGMLANNIQGEAVVIGTPWLSAGKLVGFTGLARGPETPSNPQEPQAFPVLSRIYQIVECTHHMDETGFYWTKLSVRGATTDTSLATLQQAIEEGTAEQADVMQMLEELVEEGKSAEEEEGTGGF